MPRTIDLGARRQPGAETQEHGRIRVRGRSKIPAKSLRGNDFLICIVLEGLNMFGQFLCVIAVFAVAQDAKSAIREELAQYYRSSKVPAGWDVSMKQLASKGADERSNAAKHLVDLMEQSYQDEKSGQAPWQATPFWGGPMENPARQLRSAIVASLDKTPAESEILPVVRWLLANEPQMNLQETVAGFLGKIDGEEAEVYRRTLIFQPPANAVVMGMLLAQMEERKADFPLRSLEGDVPAPSQGGPRQCPQTQSNAQGRRSGTIQFGARVANPRCAKPSTSFRH